MASYIKSRNKSSIFYKKEAGQSVEPELMYLLHAQMQILNISNYSFILDTMLKVVIIIKLRCMDLITCLFRSLVGYTDFTYSIVLIIT